MNNLTTFQLTIFYVIVGIVIIQALLAILILRSSVRYYIMFSSKIIFRNIEFVNGEIVLIGDQQDEERIKDLIYTQKFPKKVIEEKLLSQPSSSGLDADEDENRVFYNGKGLSDDVLFGYDNTLDGDADDEYIGVIQDLDMDAELEKDLSDEKRAKTIENQKSQLVQIDNSMFKIIMLILESQIKEISDSFLPDSKIYEITNGLDISLSNELSKINIPEDTIIFYRQLGITQITSRFEEFLKTHKKLKEDLQADLVKKKSSQQAGDSELTDPKESVEFWDGLISNLKDKSKKVLLRTQDQLSLELNFSV